MEHRVIFGVVKKGTGTWTLCTHDKRSMCDDEQQLDELCGWHQ
jgi:hypothetical protein